MRVCFAGLAVAATRAARRWVVGPVCAATVMGCAGHQAPAQHAPSVAKSPIRSELAAAPGARGLAGATEGPPPDALGMLAGLVQEQAVALERASKLAEQERLRALVQQRPELPAGIEVGVPTRVMVEGVGRALVVHASAEVREAAVYLHGRCSGPAEVLPWAATASSLVTLIALEGDHACGRGGGHRWGYSVGSIDRRIRRLLSRVAQDRGGLLRTHAVTLIGYSEGAHRAELLVRPFAERYPRVLLAGPPTKPEPWLLRPARAVALMAGENERHLHLMRGQRQLLSDGQLASYWTLPQAMHGSYGPAGERVVPAALSWLLRRAPSRGQAPISSDSESAQQASAPEGAGSAAEG